MSYPSAGVPRLAAVSLSTSPPLPGQCVAREIGCTARATASCRGQNCFSLVRQ
jgi:hypothetical protein